MSKSFEDKYQSPILKEKIRDSGMWALIPAVSYSIDSPKGQQRLKKHDLLFSFLDRYFPGDTYDFEPNMRDDRYVCIPSNVSHQGIGITASSMTGMLEVGHFWYPGDYTGKLAPIGMDQVYVPMFSSLPNEALVKMVQRIYIDEERPTATYCTFPFAPDVIVTLDGNFMDSKNKAIQTIRSALAGQNAQIQRNGEALIHFMQQL